MSHAKKTLLVLLFSFLITIMLLNSCTPQADERPASSETLNTLLALDPPASDWVELKAAYQGITVDNAPPPAPENYQIGDQGIFWVSRDVLVGQYEQTNITLHYVNDVVYMWVEEGVVWSDNRLVNDTDLKALGDLFASHVYPTTRATFGNEPNPGLDNDPHLHILFLGIDNAGAYFDYGDTLPVGINPHSNQREVLYVNAPAYLANQDGYLIAALAHEFTHMIHSNQNQAGESAWIAEGLAVLAEELNGYDSWMDAEFAAQLDVQLNAHRAFPQEEWVAHYGADHEFLSYLYGRFGSAFIRDVVASDTRDIRTIQLALDKHVPRLTFDQVFADWVVAYFLQQNPDDPHIQAPQGIQVPVTLVDQYPQDGDQIVHQYAADYYVLIPNAHQEITFSFDGSTSVALLPTEVLSGKYVWWAGRLDGDASLTRQVDLSQVQRATLKFSTWYDLYDHFGYSYVSVSTNNGQTWETQRGGQTTDENPNNWNLGNGLTCKSGLGCGNENDTPHWVNEEMDLTPYAGQVILLRFHCLSGSQNSGLALDDIQIPEIGFRDGAESDAGGWDAVGFARVDNRLPQRYIVQIIEIGSTIQTVQVELDKENRGSYTTSGFGDDLSKVVVIVSGATPFTWETANYRYEIR